MFARTQSTPLEGPFKMGTSSKTKLKTSTAFVPNGNSTTFASDFLRSQPETTKLASSFAKSSLPFIPEAALKTSQIALLQAAKSTENKGDVSAEANVSTSTANSSVGSVSVNSGPAKRSKLRMVSQPFALFANPTQIQANTPNENSEGLDKEQEEPKTETVLETIPEIQKEVSIPEPVSEIVIEPEHESSENKEEQFQTPAEVEVIQESFRMTRLALEATIKKLGDLLGQQKIPEKLLNIKNRLLLTPEEIKKLENKIQRAPPKKKGWADDIKDKVKSGSDESVKRDIKFNLNLLAPDNFDKIKEVLLNIAALKLENCQRVAELIVENAWSQKKYVNTYAKLCDYLGKSEKLFFADMNASSKKKSHFKLHLMKQIQALFEHNPNEDAEFKNKLEQMTPEERSLCLDKKNERTLGNVRFIGELFLEKFIVVGVVHIITKSLLQRFLEEYNEYKHATQRFNFKAHEETLRALLIFYEIVGKACEERAKDNDKLKAGNTKKNFEDILNGINQGSFTDKEVSKLECNEYPINEVFAILDIIYKKAELSSRLGSLIKNLIYMKDNDWQASLSKGEGPKTKEQIQKEFEREQMESEKSGQEYRNNLAKQKYQPQVNPSQKVQSVITKPIYKEVTPNKENKEDKPQIDMKSLNVDTNIVFKPNRSKRDAVERAPQLTGEDVEKKLKDIYKEIDAEEEKKNSEIEIRELVKKSSGKEVLKAYLNTFYDGRLEKVKQRLFIPDFLVKSDFITKAEFINVFCEVMETYSEIACDYPGLEDNLATIFLDFCDNCVEIMPLNEISFSEDFYETEESELVLEFYQQFLKSLLKNLEEDYPSLKARIKDDDLKVFAKKIKIKDYQSFQSGI